jgi:anti-anti-sigma factor
VTVGQASLVTIDRAGGRVVRLVVTGEVDVATVGELADAIVQAIFRYRSDKLVIDLASVTFLGCAGATAILAGQVLARHQGLGFSVTNVPAGARRLLILMAGVMTHGHPSCHCAR